MEKSHLKELDLPDSPGVYFFLDHQKKVLYIGKATSLRNRLKSYFASNLIETRSPIIEKMVVEAETVETVVTDSVLEALILETNLIQSHKPRYNTKSKDDKSYNHLIITNEKWPRILVVRGKDITENFNEDEIKYHFGPFTSPILLREALKIVRRLFKYYDTKEPVGTEKTRFARGKVDFNRQIGLFPDQGDLKEYQKTIKHVRLFFQGKKKQVIKELEQEMMRLAKQQKFEEANLVKRRIFALKHIEDIALLKNDRPDLSFIAGKRIEAYDVAHLDGKNMVGVMVVVKNGEPVRSEYRKFKIKSVTKANDPAALKELILRRLKHDEWSMPDYIVVDGNAIQQGVVETALKEAGLAIPVLAVVKDDKHKASRLLGAETILEKHRFEILLANAESHRFAINYYRNLQRKSAYR